MFGRNARVPPPRDFERLADQTRIFHVPRRTAPRNGGGISFAFIVAFAEPTVAKIARNGVEKAKRDQADDVILPPVGQIAL